MSKNKKHNPGFGTLNRRQLLTALGLSAGSLFLPSLGWRKGAKAQSAGVPKRLIIFTTGHGVVANTWRMTRGNTDFGNWEYNFDDTDPNSFSETLRPLHQHREKLLVIEGLAQVSTLGDPKASNAHTVATEHLLTAQMMQGEGSAGGPSVDQVIAEQVKQPGRIPSLELSTNSGLFMGGFVNFGAGQRAPTSDQPYAVFDRLFPAGSTPTAPGEEPPPPSERDLIRAARGSVLDLVAGEYEAIAPRLGNDDRQRLDQHRQLIRDLEMRVGSLANLNCGAPPDPGGQPPNQPLIAEAMFSLSAAALACDLTRVVTIQMNQLDNADFGAPAGDVHQDFAHQTNDNPFAAEMMTNFNRVHADLFGKLLSTLDQYSEGDGTLLDNTAAVWLTELATGPHDMWQIPVVMGGSCGGAFRTGRYLSHAQNAVPNPATDQRLQTVGPAHSHLLVSLMQAMGLEDNSIGASSVTTLTGSNETIDCSGPLPRLA